MNHPLSGLVLPERPTEVVDVGANSIGGDPPYSYMLATGNCHVTGFEPQQEALQKLQAKRGDAERYFPYAVGDGCAHTLAVCRSSGMTSLLEPDPAALQLFEFLRPLADVIDRIPVHTRRLDDITEVRHIDFLKTDVQGSEIAVFEGGRTKLAETVAVQTEVSFVTLYQNQAALGDIDLELRSQGFMPHGFAAIKQWPISPCSNPAQPTNQLLEADIVYVRDLTQPDHISDEQLKHLALVAHYCYSSYDLALHCIMLLERRGVIDAGTRERYWQALGQRNWTG